ncbi:MAG: tetratricopeptide repeat protein, partial [Proteobacteria bacterium]|nr:tetratricopeptide repeat protein [Pseudomonadota bacterium]
LPRALAPKAFRALLDRLLLRDPNARPTASETAEALRRLLAPHGALWWSGLSAALVLFMGGTSLWLYGRGVIAGLVKGRPARVAVMGFRNATGVPMLNAQTKLGLADLVASRLRAEPKLEVLSAEAVAQAARALKLDPANAAPDDQLRLAKALGADLILSGAVDRKDGKDRLAFVLRDAKGRQRTQGETEAPQLSETMLDAIPLAQAASRSLHKAVDPFAKSAPQDPYTIPPEAFAAYAQGVEAYRRGHYKEAEPLLKQAAYAVPEWTDACATYAFALSGLGKPEADEALRWALVAARAKGGVHDESAVVQIMAWQAFRHREFATSGSYFESALQQADSQRDLADRAFCLNGLGLVAEAQGHRDLAAHRYQEALTAAEQGGNLITSGKALANLGNLALGQGDLPGAAQRYQAVVHSAHLIGSEANEALGLNNLGIVLFSEFKTAEARMALERSLALREKNGDAYGVVSVQRNLGINSLIEGRVQEARLWFQKSLETARPISFHYGQGQALFYLAECDRMAGALGAALTTYEAAILESESVHDQDKQGPEQAGKAECLLRLHRRSEADSALAKAIAAAPGNPCVLRARAWEAYLRGDRSAAVDLVDQAILDPKHDAPELRPELEGLRSRFTLP